MTSFILVDEIQNNEEIPGKPTFFPEIFDNYTSNANLPIGFNSVKIKIDGRANGTLNWKNQRELALDAIGNGLKIFWEIDLGLFNQLTSSLSDQTQFLSLKLSLTYFRDTLWNEFQNYSIGVCLYRGSVDFSLDFPWDDEQEFILQTWLEVHQYPLNNSQKLSETSEGLTLIQLFCSEVGSQYMCALGQCLPDLMPKFVLLNTDSINELFLTLQLTSKEKFQGFHRGISSFPFSESIIVKSYGTVSNFEIKPNPIIKSYVGVCLSKGPKKNSDTWESVLKWLVESNIGYRSIPEEFLTVEWDGLDYIFIMPSEINPQGIRKLRGFCAAGGTIVNLEGKLGFSQELSFAEWQKSLMP